MRKEQLMAARKGGSGSKKQLKITSSRTQKTTNGKTTSGRGYTQASYGSSKSQKRPTGPVSMISRNGKTVMNPNSQMAETRAYIANWAGSEGPKRKPTSKKTTKKTTKKKK